MRIASRCFAVAAILSAPLVWAQEPAPVAPTPATTPAAAAPDTIQAGASIVLVKPTLLFPRSHVDETFAETFDAGATAGLKLKLNNAEGTWWYAEIDGHRGWLRESDLR